MKLVIHWADDMPIDVPHLLAKKLQFDLQERKYRRVKFSYLGTLQKMIDIYQPTTIRLTSSKRNTLEGLK